MDPSSFSGTVRNGMDLDISLRATDERPTDAGAKAEAAAIREVVKTAFNLRKSTRDERDENQRR